MWALGFASGYRAVDKFVTAQYVGDTRAGLLRLAITEVERDASYHDRRGHARCLIICTLILLRPWLEAVECQQTQHGFHQWTNTLWTRPTCNSLTCFPHRERSLSPYEISKRAPLSVVLFYELHDSLPRDGYDNSQAGPDDWRHSLPRDTV